MTTAFAAAVFSAESRLTIIVPSGFSRLPLTLSMRAGIIETNSGEVTQNVPAKAEIAAIALLLMMPTATAQITDAAAEHGSSSRTSLLSLESAAEFLRKPVVKPTLEE